VLLYSSKNLKLISVKILELWEDLERNAKKLRDSYPLPLKLKSKLMVLLKVKIYSSLLLDLNSNNFAYHYSKLLLNQLKTVSEMLKLPKIKFMKSSWLVDLLEFQRLSTCLKISSTEKLQIDLLTQMKLLLMVLLSKLLLSLVLAVKKLAPFFFLMLSHFPLVLKPLEVWWLSSSKETLLSQPKKLKTSQLMLITNLVYWSKFMKVKDQCAKITTSLVNSTLMVSHLLQEVLHKFQSALMLMPMESLTLLLWKKVLVNLKTLPLPMKKVDSLKMTSKNSSKKLNNTKLKMMLLKRKSK